jgi:hypothetical protein
MHAYFEMKCIISAECGPKTSRISFKILMTKSSRMGTLLGSSFVKSYRFKSHLLHPNCTLTVTDSSTAELEFLQGRKGLIRTSMIKMAIE